MALAKDNPDIDFATIEKALVTPQDRLEVCQFWSSRILTHFFPSGCVSRKYERSCWRPNGEPIAERNVAPNDDGKSEEEG